MYQREELGQVHLLIDSARVAWPMTKPDARMAAGLGFDHRAGGGVAQGAAVDEGGCCQTIRRTGLHRAGHGRR